MAFLICSETTIDYLVFSLIIRDNGVLIRVVFPRAVAPCKTCSTFMYPSLRVLNLSIVNLLFPRLLSMSRLWIFLEINYLISKTGKLNSAYSAI